MHPAPPRLPVLHAVLALAAAVPLAGCVAVTSNKTVTAAPARAPITEQQVNAAQQAWCDGLVRVAQTHAQGGDAKAEAGRMIDALYDYADGKVFFKPTLAFGPRTFRPTREGALAYFVGGNPAFPEDTGFAL